MEFADPAEPLRDDDGLSGNDRRRWIKQWLEAELQLSRNADSASTLASIATQLHQRLQSLPRDDTLPAPASPGFGGWNDVLEAQRRSQHLSHPPSRPVDSVHRPPPTAVRMDPPSPSVPRPKFANRKSANVSKAKPAQKFSKQPLAKVESPSATSLAVVADDQPPPRRIRPAAMIVSAIVHGLLLLGLAAIGFQVHQPKDQISLTSDPAASEEMAVETITIETVEPTEVVEEMVEPNAIDLEAELSPIGSFAVGKPNLDAPPAFAKPLAAMMASATTPASLSKMSLTSDSKMQFCGVEGGGNHFIYIVDSSKSMREGFSSARQALIQSIEALKSTQRFYVIFFDEEPDYMRIRDPGTDEPDSVYATDDNKLALKRWAMSIQQNNGKAPYDPINFALKRRPDVIFLLSDGEFTSRFEDFVNEENRFENLFDGPQPISIIHTIAYHSRAGEDGMRRIAQSNDGQFRFVPK